MSDKLRCVAGLVIVGVLGLGPGVALAQSSDAAGWAAHLSNQYRVLPNVTYSTASNWDSTADLYLPRGADTPTPVLMYIHGGGWVGGTKESSVLRLLPWLEMGWAVVNVEYRLGQVALAPAAVEDCLCALRWMIRNAERYNIDPTRIVVTGNSAGGHLSLTTGMLPASAGLDRQCPGSEELTVAAVINWYGITDVGDLLDGPNMKSYAVEWMGSMPNRFEIAERVSPLTYVRARAAADSDDSWRRRPDRAVPARGGVARGADPRGHPESAAHRAWWSARRVQQGTDAEDLRNDPTVPEAARARERRVDISRTGVTSTLVVGDGRKSPPVPTRSVGEVDYRANGSGRSWKWTILLLVPRPPSVCQT